MKMDNFTGLRPFGLARRIDRGIDRDTRLPDGVTSEVVEGEMILESREHFEKIYRYVSGRRYVYISDWKYDEGFYQIRIFRLTPLSVNFTVTFSMVYKGRETISSIDTNPMEPGHRVLIEEDFSGWPIGSVSWPLASSGVGNQYESKTWDFRETGGAAAWIIQATSGTYERPDGGSGRMLRNLTWPANVLVTELDDYSCLEVRASIGASHSSNGTGIIFKGHDWTPGGSKVQNPKRGMIISATPTHIQIFRFDGTSPGDYGTVAYIPLPVGITRPTATSSTSILQGEWYEIKVRLYGPVIEIFFDGKYVDTVKWDWFKAGTVGLMVLNAASFCSDFVVKRIPVPVHMLPVGAYNISEFVHDAIYTKSGWAQRVISPYEPVKYMSKTPNTGTVHVWDMRDGDFRNPWRWEEVTSSDHLFQGNMFVENEICGILHDGTDTFYYYSEHLKDVLVGFDTSAWWSQGYALRNIGPLKSYLSPTTMKGSLFKQYRWKDPFWFLNVTDKWEQNNTYNFGLLTTPQVEADFYFNNWAWTTPDLSTPRILSYNETAVIEGVYLGALSKQIRGGHAQSGEENIITGDTVMTPARVHKAKYFHSADSRVIWLDGEIDDYEPVPFNHAVYETAGATLVPMRDETGSVLAMAGGISRMVLKDRRLGLQSYMGLDSSDIVAWLTFDRANFNRSLGSFGSILDLSGNNNHLTINDTDSDDPGEMVNGVINEALRLQGGSSSVCTKYEHTTVVGHTSDAEFGLSFWIRFDTDVTANEVADVVYIELLTSADVSLFSFWYDFSETEFRVTYGGVLHAQISVALLDDQKMHLVRITDTGVFIDGTQSGSTTNTITGQIGKLYVNGADMAAGSKFTIDELVIVDVAPQIDDWAPSYSDIPILNTKHLKAEFDGDIKNRWNDWKSSDLLLYAIFNGGAEDIGPSKFAITEVGSSVHGYYKQGGFYFSLEEKSRFTTDHDFTLEDGFTIMWKGHNVTYTISHVVHLFTSGGGDSVRVRIASSGIVALVVSSASGNSTYSITLDTDYHEFHLTFKHGDGATLWVDGVKQTWTFVTGDYGEVPKTVVAGNHFFGGGLVNDIVFIKKVIPLDRMGYHPQEEIEWKKYYKFSFDDGSTQSLVSPKLSKINKNATEIVFNGKHKIRIESGNPFVSFEDLERNNNDLYIYDETDDWGIAVTPDDIYDARQGGSVNIPLSEVHKYLFAPHVKSNNGFTTLSIVEGRYVTILSNVNRVYAVAKIEECNHVIVGFMNWPLWNFWKEGGDADTFGNSAVRDKDASNFFSVGTLPGATDYVEFDFSGQDFGSYLLVVKSEVGTFTLNIGDSGDGDKHLYEAVVTTPEYVRAFNWSFMDLATELTIKNILVRLTYSASVDNIDYVAILPISNGLHFPLDFIQQMWSRNG